MAICHDCEREMLEADSCSVEEVRIGGSVRARLRWRPGERTLGRCHDCGIRPGGWHHLGCDMERCPCCRGQLISCACTGEQVDGAEGDVKPVLPESRQRGLADR